MQVIKSASFEITFIEGNFAKLGVWSVTILLDPCEAPKPIPLLLNASLMATT